jgi:hypothetical protein
MCSEPASIGLQDGINFHVVFLEPGSDEIEGFIHVVRKLE